MGNNYTELDKFAYSLFKEDCPLTLMSMTEFLETCKNTRLIYGNYLRQNYYDIAKKQMRKNKLQEINATQL